MSALILPHRLQQQPQQVAVVDWGNPGSRGLRAAVVPGIAEAVTGGLARTVAGTPVLGATSAGRAWAFASSAVDIPSVAYVAPPFSLLVVVRKSDLIADTLVSFGGIGAGRGWKFGSGGASAASAATARLTYGGVADYNLSTGFWDITGGVTVALLVVSGTTAKLFKPGRLVSTSTVGTPSATAPVKPLTLGAGFNNTAYTELSTSSVNFVELWNRALPDGEALEMVSQAWQMLKAPARRLWYGAAAVTEITGSFAGFTAGAMFAASGALTATGTLSSSLAGCTLAASGAVGSVPTGTLASTLNGASFSATGIALNAGAFASSLTGATMNLAGMVRSDGAFASTLAGASLDATGAARQNATGIFASTLDGASMAAGGYVGIPPETAGFFQRLPRNPRHFLTLH